MGNAIDDQSLLGLTAGVLLLGLLRDEVPELIDVDRWAVNSVLVESENSDALLTVESWMVLEHIDSLVVLSTGLTSTRVMLSVLADSSVSHGDLSSQLSGLL